MSEILKGAPVANAITEDLVTRVAHLQSNGIVPTLAILRVGERGDDIAYERGAIKRCEKIGIRINHFLLPEDCTRERLLKTIETINNDASIHGCLMFRPLADKETETAACSLLDPAKDVDCMTSGSLATVFSGNGAGYPPCTAQACIEILKHYGVDPCGKRAVVIGRSMVIGRPVAMLLMQANATVTICHTKTKDMPGICREADILIAAVGRAGTVDASYVNPSQVILDVGINVDEEGKLCGDVRFDEVCEQVSAITPVPAGVGSVTTAVLAKHVVEAAEKLLGK